MKNKVRWITQTAIMLALLIALQAFTKSFGQLVTGSCVNAVLAIAVLVGGMASGVTIAVISPVMAFLLGIAPQIVTVPAIMAGNTVFVVVLRLISGPQSKPIWKQITAWLIAAAAKFAVLYIVVVKIICGVASEALLASGSLKAPMINALPLSFGVTQLFTALIGGAAALVIVPTIRKALHR